MGVEQTGQVESPLPEERGEGEQHQSESSRVVRARLRDALRAGPDLAAERIDLTIGDDDVLDRVEVDLVCAYGTDVRAAAELARSLVEGVLVEVLGAGTRPPVDVDVTDVVVGDVRLT